MLHIAYRMKLKCWVVRGEDNKEIVLNEKKRAQQELKKQLWLREDYPVPGSGSSNTWNTARFCFNNIEVVSEITGLNKNVHYKLSIILKTLNSGFEIDIENF